MSGIKRREFILVGRRLCCDVASSHASAQRIAPPPARRRPSRWKACHPRGARRRSTSGGAYGDSGYSEGT